MEARLFDAEYRFMELLWQNEPIKSTQLAKLCEERLGWKKPTAFSMLKKLESRGVIQNEAAVVTALLPRLEAQRAEGEAVLQKAFGGSLPGFVAAFLKNKPLTQAEAEELHRLIEEARRHE